MTALPTAMTALARSWLFVPADSERKLARAREVPADALILDLEDAVVPDRKPIARQMAAEFLRARHGEAAGGPVAGAASQTASPHRPALWVRVNARSSGLLADDVRAIMPTGPDGLLLPKAESPQDLWALDALMAEAERQTTPGMPAAIMALVSETPGAVLNLARYAWHADGQPARVPARLVALTWGGEDLSSELGALTHRDADGGFRFTYQLARSGCQLAAAAAGVAAVETLCADFRNMELVARQASRAAEDGFIGMLAIHPSQVPVINAAFAPTPEQVQHAERVLAAFAAADAGQGGPGAIQLDGRMLDRPHRTQAERLLGRAR